jgi:hypothetical protein
MDFSTLTPDERKKILANKGYAPDTHEIDNTGRILPLTPTQPSVGSPQNPVGQFLTQPDQRNVPSVLESTSRAGASSVLPTLGGLVVGSLAAVHPY